LPSEALPVTKSFSSTSETKQERSKTVVSRFIRERIRKVYHFSFRSQALFFWVAMIIKRDLSLRFERNVSLGNFHLGSRLPVGLLEDDLTRAPFAPRKKPRRGVYRQEKPLLFEGPEIALEPLKKLGLG